MRVNAMQPARVNGIDLEYDVTGSGDLVLLISPVVADGFLPLVSERALAHYRLNRHSASEDVRGRGSGVTVVRPKLVS